MFEELEKYKSLELRARQIVEGYLTGLHRSPFHGFSVEFAEHRPYNTGESTKDIDWKLYGRTDKLFVKRYEEETNLRCMLVIDHSCSMFFPTEGHLNLEHPNKLTFACYAAAVLIELLARQRDAFGLTLVSDKIDLQTDIRSSRTHQRQLLQLLQQELSQPIDDKRELRPTSIADSLHLLAEQVHRRSLIVVMTDAFVHPQEWEPMMDALRHLKHGKHEVLLFHTYDLQHELNFDYPNRPTEFIDLESGQRLKVNPSEVAEHYRQEMHRQTADLKQRATQYGIEYLPAEVANGFEQIMLPFLLRRSKHY